MTNLALLNKEDLREMIAEAIVPLMKEMQHHQSKTTVTTSQSDLLTRKETAAYLKITLPTLNVWTKEGVIHSIRICSRVYYSRSELQRFSE